MRYTKTLHNSLKYSNYFSLCSTFAQSALSCSYSLYRCRIFSPPCRRQASRLVQYVALSPFTLHVRSRCQYIRQRAAHGSATVLVFLNDVKSTPRLMKSTTYVFFPFSTIEWLSLLTVQQHPAFSRNVEFQFWGTVFVKRFALCHPTVVCLS